MSVDLAQLRGFYAVGNLEDWSGQTEYEIAELLGQALDIADQQAARIAELEAEVARLRTFASELANAHAVEADDIRQRARKALAG
jgi:hypothetical protein